MKRLAVAIAILGLLSGCADVLDGMAWLADNGSEYHPPVTTACNSHGSHTTCTSW
jgi:uncharacterized protein YceK